MNDLDVKDVTGALRDASIDVKTDRRAFGNRRGVPDFVAWLSPKHSAFPDRVLPVLVELEGSFGAAAADFQKFARRYNDPKYKHNLDWPTAAEGISPIRRTCKYDIAGIPARRLGRGYSVNERTFYECMDEWFNEFKQYFDRSIRVREYGDTTVINWDLQFTMYGHDFGARVPLFVEVGDDLTETIESYISSPTIPSAVIINDEVGPNTSTTSYHSTMIEFPELRAIRFRESILIDR